MGKRKLFVLLNLSTWCLVMVEWLFLAVPWGCLRFVIVVFPDHTHLLFWFVDRRGKTRKWTAFGHTVGFSFAFIQYHQNVQYLFVQVDALRRSQHTAYFQKFIPFGTFESCTSTKQ